jgi:hypothetical protein
VSIQTRPNQNSAKKRCGLGRASQQNSAKAGIDDHLEELRELINNIDSDGSGQIDYTEFLAATLDKKQYLKEDVCWAAFRVGICEQ